MFSKAGLRLNEIAVASLEAQVLSAKPKGHLYFYDPAQRRLFYLRRVNSSARIRVYYGGPRRCGGRRACRWISDPVHKLYPATEWSPAGALFTGTFSRPMRVALESRAMDQNSISPAECAVKLALFAVKKRRKELKGTK